MIITEKLNNMRLDVALGEHELCKDMGLRARKRLCEQGLVFVNGRLGQPHLKLQLGQEVSVLKLEEDGEEEDSKNINIQEILIKEDKNFLAFYKRSGLPSANIPGSINYSLEEEILKYHPNLILLNRLDTETSGIVIFAKTLNAETLWKEAQERGEIQKKYIALVEGEVKEKLSIKNKLDLSKTKVKALELSADNKNRYTLVRPLDKDFSLSENFMNKVAEYNKNNKLAKSSELYNKNNDKTCLVECTIFKGARHQIRCHLANAGFPLVNDSLYNDNAYTDNFLLYHYRIESKLFNVTCSF